MNVKSLFTFIICCILINAEFSYAQSRSGIGIGVGVNRPFSHDYNFGSSIQFQVNLPLGNQWAIVPDIAYDRLSSKGGYVYDPVGPPSTPIANVNLYHTGLSLKYFFSQQWYVNAGGMYYLGQGGEDTVGSGAGGWGGVGYQLDLDKYNTLLFSFTTGIVNIVYNGNGVTPIGGLKVIYVVNFKSIK
ncbi:MAG: hypothetical protein JWQ66_4158 [Mucilaginibacter sp.]|nr:hypothetical protein [Mucilaginibacter sp.]